MMHKWLLVASFVCVAVADKNLFLFDPHITILSRCIEHHLGNIDDRYKSTPVGKTASDLAAKRFHGKSMSSELFKKRFNTFFSDLKNSKVRHNLRKDQLSNLLRYALESATTLCASNHHLSAGIAISEKEKIEQKSVQNEEWISFSINEDWLYDCIESHLELTGRPEFLQEKGLLTFMVDSATRRYHGKKFSRKNFHKSHLQFFYYLRKKIILHDLSLEILTAELELSVKKAVEDCAIGTDLLTTVPIFDTEPTEIAHLLNLILVKWPNDLRDMIQSQNDRALLRRYASDARTSLLRVINNFQYNTKKFRLALRSYWRNRAQKMYDANSVELPYIVHRYSLNYPTPHMVLSDFDKFINRTNQDFKDRNPFVPRSYVNKVLNVHTSDRENIEGEFGIFDNYSNNGMTSSEYYLENQINQFYRIIFFFMELCARGICTDEDDYYKELPIFLVPKQIQAIIYDDEVYRDYLLDERFIYESFLSNNTQNEIAKNLFEKARVFEENLILLRSNIPSVSGVQPSTTTESSTDMTMQSLKRKDNVWKNKNGKCFPCKQARITTFQDNDYSDTNDLYEVTKLLSQRNCSSILTDTTDEIFTTSSKFSESQEQNKMENNDIFGYTEFNEDVLDQSRFSYQDSLLFQEILSIAFASDDHYLF